MTEQLASGQVLQDDLRVASQVASGALRRDGLVMALLRSAIHMNNAESRGCLRTRTSKFLDQDALGQEFVLPHMHIRQFDLKHARSKNLHF